MLHENWVAIIVLYTERMGGGGGKLYIREVYVHALTMYAVGEVDILESGHFALSGNRAISKRRTVLRCICVTRRCTFIEQKYSSPSSVTLRRRLLLILLILLPSG